MKIFAKMMSVLLIFSMVMMSALVFAGSVSGLFTPTVTDYGQLNTANRILSILQWVGYAVAVGMLIYIGIKYVMASADEKANLKNSLIRYVIGAVLIAGAVTIAGWVTKIVE